MTMFSTGRSGTMQLSVCSAVAIASHPYVAIWNVTSGKAQSTSTGKSDVFLRCCCVKNKETTHWAHWWTIIPNKHSTRISEWDWKKLRSNILRALTSLNGVTIFIWGIRNALHPARSLLFEWFLLQIEGNLMFSVQKFKKTDMWIGRG
jgi:hypothetical protein